MTPQPFCEHRVTRLVREVNWWDHYMVCERHVAWARSRFPKGMRLVETVYPGKGYQEIASGCVAPRIAGGPSKREDQRPKLDTAPATNDATQAPPLRPSQRRERTSPSAMGNAVTTLPRVDDNPPPSTSPGDSLPTVPPGAPPSPRGSNRP